VLQPVLEKNESLRKGADDSGVSQETRRRVVRVARCGKKGLFLEQICQVASTGIGRRGQHLVQAPGDNRKVYGFGLVDWRDGWFDGRVAKGAHRRCVL
jgi:hypothetical protein